MDIFSMMQQQLGVFLLILLRVSGICMAAPIFGSRNIPQYAKIGFSLALTYIIFPMVYHADIVIPEQVLPYLFLVAKEFLVGLLLGIAGFMVFYAVQMSGQVLDTQIGFGMVNIMDPMSGHQVPLVGNFKYILAVLIFLAINGHHVLLAALFESFTIVPVAHVSPSLMLTGIFLNMVSKIFIIAFKLTLPVLVALLLTDLSLGILARTMPQMNIFVVGVPGKIGIGIFVLSLALPFYIYFLEVAFNEMYSDIYYILHKLV